MTSLNIERRVLPQATHSEGKNFGIYDESHLLKSAVIWGPVGVEAALAQLYPPEISLFFNSFDVLAARREGLEYARTLENFGVKVAFARDFLVDLLPANPDLKKEEVTSQLRSKSKGIQETYRSNSIPVEDNIMELLEDDIARYGQERALTLNQALCLDTNLPLGNLIYARDQMNVLLGQRVVSAMAKEIRKPEVALYEEVYKSCLSEHSPIRIPSGETFEGGDAYIHQGYVWVGVGVRTTLGAALKIYDGLKPELDKHELKFAVVQDEDPFNRPFSEQQDFMHLDTFSNPTGRRDIAVCIEEAARRKVTLISTHKGSRVIKETGLSFIDYLEHAVKDEVLRISEEEQRQFGCNFLLLGEDDDGTATIFVPLNSNSDINNQLRRRGKKVVPADLYQSTRGYGAAHCMTGQLLREESGYVGKA